MRKVIPISLMLAAISAAALAQPPAPAQTPAAAQPEAGAQPGAPGAPGGGRGGGRGGPGGPGGPGGQFQPGEGRGPGGQGGQGGRGRGPQAQTPAPTPAPTTVVTAMPVISLPPLPPVPTYPTISGTVIRAPDGFYQGMAVTNGNGMLYGRVVKADDQASLVVQTMDGKQHAVPADKLSIKNSIAVTDLTELQFRKLPGTGAKHS